MLLQFSIWLYVKETSANTAALAHINMTEYRFLLKTVDLYKDYGLYTPVDLDGLSQFEFKPRKQKRQLKCTNLNNLL